MGLVGAVAACVLALAGWSWLHAKLPQRWGQAPLPGLDQAVQVDYDERGVPHIRAQTEADLYRALGYVHAQDRLFQMEMARRLAQGELAEVLGPKLLDVDRLFRTLGLREHARQTAPRLKADTPALRALQAYLDGVNEFQQFHPAPLEFELLGIPKRPFTVQDTLAISGYLAYSFAAAFRTEPAMTAVRDQLGAPYLRIFEAGASEPAAVPLALGAGGQAALNRVAQVSQQVLQELGLPQFEGSNAWAVAGSRTASGKPLLAGDPHIAYSAPAVWYEAHLQAPGFELYGHFQALNPLALLGHNTHFGWTLTMFQNDDVDLIAERVNPDNPRQVWYHGAWVDLTERTETIQVKGAAPVPLVLRRSPHGPLITDAFADSLGTQQPVALWWAYLETENPVLDAFYQLNRADTLDQARAAASLIHAPGLNVVWANAAGDIGWWAAAKLPIRPDGVNPQFILDGATVQADKLGFAPFADNPQEENPARGYIVSANHAPAPRRGVQVPGYYNLTDRATQIDQHLSPSGVRWNLDNSRALQLDPANGYSARVLAPLLPELRASVTDPAERALLERLAAWKGSFTLDDVAPTLFTQFCYELARAALADELGEAQFKNLLRTRALDFALPRLAHDAQSPWWDRRSTPGAETRAQTVRAAWDATLAHLRATFGTEPGAWQWGRAHTLTHSHPLAAQKPLDKLFNTGPLGAPGGRETPNNLSGPIGPAPWAVAYGPSTRRLIDFAQPDKALGINPVGQSGVLFDAHYRDQARTFIDGGYVPQHLSREDVQAATRSTLRLAPP